MEDYVTPALAQRTSGGGGFNYKPPTEQGGNERRQNIFFGSADDERVDSAKYTEAMEQKMMHADKGLVTGELMKSKGLGLVEHIDTMSTSFMHSSETEAAVRAMLLAEKNRPKPMAVEDAPDPLVYTVDATADPEAEARWQLERERKRELQDAKTAKNRKKRQKKKGAPAEAAEDEPAGPSVPSIGPSRGPHQAAAETEAATPPPSDGEDEIGPPMPPSMQAPAAETEAATPPPSDGEDEIGPPMPPSMQAPAAETEAATPPPSDGEDEIGPPMPPAPGM